MLSTLGESALNRGSSPPLQSVLGTVGGAIPVGRLAWFHEEPRERPRVAKARCAGMRTEDPRMEHRLVLPCAGQREAALVSE